MSSGVLSTPDDQGTSADLSLLHSLLGHYARVLWDIQKTRIAMGNRVAAMERDNTKPQHMAMLADMEDRLDDMERDVNNHLRRLASRHPLAPWIEEAVGIGLPGFARILGVTGPLDQFATVSKVWKYMGMHVTAAGTAPKRQKGEKLDYSPQGRVVCHQLGESIVKVGRGKYREAYDTKKAAYLARERTGESQCPFGQTHKDKSGKVMTCGLLHAHNAAMRFAVKLLLKDLWIAWHNTVPLSQEQGAQ